MNRPVTATLDVREMAPRKRHPTILSTFDALEPGEALELVNDHDPKPLRYQFEAENPETFTWDYLEQGRRPGACGSASADRKGRRVRDDLWTLVRFLHVLGAALWVGGMIVLGAVAVPAARRAGDRDAGRRVVTAAARRFGVVGALAFVALVATGFGLIHHRGIALDQLDESDYGRRILAKIGLLAAMGVVTLLHALWQGPGCAGPRRRATRSPPGAGGCWAPPSTGSCWSRPSRPCGWRSRSCREPGGRRLPVIGTGACGASPRRSVRERHGATRRSCGSRRPSRRVERLPGQGHGPGTRAAPGSGRAGWRCSESACFLHNYKARPRRPPSDPQPD